jgi:hypothetical protein
MRGGLEGLKLARESRGLEQEGTELEKQRGAAFNPIRKTIRMTEMRFLRDIRRQRQVIWLERTYQGKWILVRIAREQRQWFRQGSNWHSSYRIDFTLI